MKYMLLLCRDEPVWEKMSQAERVQAYDQMVELSAELTRRGQYLAGSPLHPSSSATTVRVRNGKVSATDGPFAETKEQLGGYYLVEAGDRDEAVRIAARIPGAWIGSVEVRPVAEDAETRRLLDPGRS